MAEVPSTATKTVTIKPGEKIILPDSAEIISLVVNGSIAVTSTCDNLPDPSSYQCWRFLWEDVSDDGAYDDAYFTSIEIAGTKYSFSAFASISGEPNTYDNGPDYLALAIPLVTPVGLVTDITSNDTVGIKCIKISIPDNLAQPVLYWENPLLAGGNQLSAMFPVVDECSCV